MHIMELLLIQTFLVIYHLIGFSEGEQIVRKSFDHGENLLLACDIRPRLNSSLPIGELSWKKDGLALASTNLSYDITMTNENTTSIVSKQNLTQSDEGNYSCEVNGSVFKTFKVHLNSKVRIRGQKHIGIELGNDLELTCIGVGDIDLEWTTSANNFQKLNINVSMNGAESTLKINTFGMNDTGEYTCLGRRSLGNEIEETTDTITVTLAEDDKFNPEKMWPYLLFGILSVFIAGLVTGYFYYYNTKRLRQSNGAAYLKTEASP